MYLDGLLTCLFRFNEVSVMLGFGGRTYGITAQFT